MEKQKERDEKKIFQAVLPFYLQPNISKQNLYSDLSNPCLPQSKSGKFKQNRRKALKQSRYRKMKASAR